MEWMTCLLTTCAMRGCDEQAQCFLQLQGWWDFGDASGEHNRKPVLHSGVMKQIAGWFLAAGDYLPIYLYLSFVHRVFTICSSSYIRCLSFVHIPNIPISHENRQIVGAEAREPCQRGSWGKRFLDLPGRIRIYSKVQKHPVHKAIRSEDKRLKTRLLDHTLPALAFGAWLHSIWTWTCYTFFHSEAEKLEEKAEAPPPPVSPTSPPVEPAKLEPQSEPAKLDTVEGKAGKKGKQMKKCCPLWGKFVFFLRMTSRGTRTSRRFLQPFSQDSTETPVCTGQEGSSTEYFLKF